MCGRLDLSESENIMALYERLNLSYAPVTSNVTPTESVPVICIKDQHIQLATMRWWLTPSWAPEISTKFSMFNARAETITTSKAFKEPFRRQRCVIPVNAYYEWQTEGKTKKPFRIHAGNSPMMLAGIWDVWQRDGSYLQTCSIITTEAVPELSWLHTRQPLFIPEVQMQHWLDPHTPFNSLVPYLLPHKPYPLCVTPVDAVVGNARYKGIVNTVGETIVVS